MRRKVNMFLAVGLGLGAVVPAAYTSSLEEGSIVLWPRELRQEDLNPDASENEQNVAIIETTAPRRSATGSPPEICTADLDGDGVVGASDLAILLGSWGPCFTNLVFNGEFTKHADGWELIDHDAANWQRSPGWDGNPGWFKINDFPGEFPETWQLITGLIPDETYVVSGYFNRLHDNNTDPNFRVLLDDDVLFEAGGCIEDGWIFFSFDYVADNNEVVLLFRAQVTTDDDYGIDNIRFVRK